MADLRCNPQHYGWSKVGDNVFKEITMRLDTISVVRLTACSKKLYRQVTDGKGSRCPSDRCCSLVSYNDVYEHMIQCCYAPCAACTEQGCKFVNRPLTLHELFDHLKVAHKMYYLPQVTYSNEYLYPTNRVHAPEIIGIGKEGTEFPALIGAYTTDIFLSVRYVRLAACESPRYKVMLWLLPSWNKLHSVEMAATSEQTNMSSLVEVALKGLMSYLSKPRRYLRASQDVVRIPPGLQEYQSRNQLVWAVQPNMSSCSMLAGAVQWNCVVPGCEFAAIQFVLYSHLIEAHAMRLCILHYGRKGRYISKPVSTPGSQNVDIGLTGFDDTVFCVLFDGHDDVILISVVCIRPAACVSPQFMVKLSSTHPNGLCEKVFYANSKATCSLSVCRSNLVARCRNRPSKFTVEYKLHIDNIITVDAEVGYVRDFQANSKLSGISGIREIC